MKYVVCSAIIILCVIKGYSQNGFIISYPIAFPMGDQYDYISQTSFRGYSMEFLHHAKPGIAVGIETGWSVFYAREDKKDYTKGTQTISGVQYRYTNSVPILAETKFYPTSSKKTAQSYLGIGVGTLYVNRSTDFGLYRITNEAWQFCVRPEVGVSFKIEPGLRAFTGVKYYMAFNSSDLDGQSFLSANIGLVFTSL
jgi:hypothetical protein